MIKKDIIILIRFSNLRIFQVNFDYLITALSKINKIIHVINAENLNFIKNKKKSIYKKKSLPKNFLEYHPKNTKEFKYFLLNKNPLFINFLHNSLNDFKILFLIRKFKQISIANIGNIQFGSVTNFRNISKNPINNLKYISYRISKKIIKILSILGLLPKIEIKFSSNKNDIKNIFNNPLKKFLYKKKYLYTKKIILVNSRSYENFLNLKSTISNKYIVHLDAYLNYYHETDLIGKRSNIIIKNHYFFLKRFLKKISITFGRKIIVCIHPHYPINFYKKYLKGLKIVKLRTKEYIFKAFLVTVFDSSAILDAIFLKKKIIGLTSQFMSINEKKHALRYSNEAGFINMDTIKDYNFRKNYLIKKLKYNTKNYNKYLANYLFHYSNLRPSEQIIRYINK